MNSVNQQINYSPLKIVPNDSNGVEISCPQCSGKNYMKAGFNKGKQRYKCKDCNRQFVNNPRYEKLEPPKDFDFDNDVWSAEHLGLISSPSRLNRCLNFAHIEYEWLKYYAKQFILFNSSHKSYGTLLNCYLPTLKDFSLYLTETAFIGEIEDIDRELILGYMTYLKQKNLDKKTIRFRLGALHLFFTTGVTNSWFKVEPYLIREGDRPTKTKSYPRHIPDEVISQLNKHLDKLPEQVMRMVLIIQECGLRVSELLTLKYDCVRVSAQGSFFLHYYMAKMSKEHTKPISNELVEVIKEQQKYIRDLFGDNYSYLFSGFGANKKPTATIMSQESFNKYLQRLANDYEIKDYSGKIWHFQSHQFRHTVGTRMINLGVPHHIVQKYLGHESPEMTNVYAHIFDETLKAEIEKYHESRVVNFQGESVELEHTVLSSNDDLEWFKKNVQARALEHGYCARPKVLGDCDITGFDGCYDCPHWRTNKNFLPILKDTLERTNNVIEKARNCGWELQVKKNQPIQSNLQKVIASLEEEENE